MSPLTIKALRLRQHLWALVVGLALSISVSTCQAASSPVVIPPIQYFEGNDGPWSTFNIRVGTKQQDARVLVSTAAPETLVVLSEFGCSSRVMEHVPSDCAVSRGKMFSPNDSSTWNQLGNFGINGEGVGLEANLGYQQAASFGLDTLGIGLVDGSEGATLQNQTIGGIATANPFYLGIFGINTQPLNFSSLGNFSSPSFIATLKDQEKIPSLSWSYTAGAMYRLKKVYGQLIFSGYDRSRFIENTISFTMAGDVTRDLVVALQAVTYSGTTQASLLLSPINIYIDSTDPHIWLPDTAVKAFESAFGLVLDKTSGLYLVNDTHHATLLASSAEVSFRLSDVLEGGETVTITLSYSAFDLQAEYPLVKNTSYYFPLKSAANESQYTLGRTFLQEAYLTVDYEKRVFNVSQCTWNEGAKTEIIPILSNDGNSTSTSNLNSSTRVPENSSNGESKSGISISPGAIAGMAVGIFTVIALVAMAGFLLHRRRRQQSRTVISPVVSRAPSPAKSDSRKTTNTDQYTENELAGDYHYVYQLHSEPKSSASVGSAQAHEVYELAGCQTPWGDTGIGSSPRISISDDQDVEEMSIGQATPKGL